MTQLMLAKSIVKRSASVSQQGEGARHSLTIFTGPVTMKNELVRNARL